jgi:putative Mn2+ efflux pump MntP
MPLVGFLLGGAAGGLLGRAADYVSIALLVGVGLYLLREGMEVEHHTLQNGGPLLLLATALSVSLDELAVGLSLGLLGLPVLVTCGLIAGQAFLFTLAGIALGGVLGGRFVRRGGLLSGIVLITLALLLLVRKLYTG